MIDNCNDRYTRVDAYKFILTFKRLERGILSRRVRFKKKLLICLFKHAVGEYQYRPVESTQLQYMSSDVRKPVFCICENKDAEQLRSNCAADQRLCFRYIDSVIPLLSKFEISSL